MIKNLESEQVSSIFVYHSDKTDDTNKMALNAKVTTTTVEQTANELLGTKAKTLWYLIIENGKGEKYVLNVGEKTHNEIKKMTDVVTNIKVDKPQTGGKI